MRECIEFSWDERTEISEFVYENDRTGELTVETKRQPMAKPEVTEDTKLSYFANLIFWLNTQPMYD